MDRRALIIANPGEVGSEDYCEGVNEDTVSYGSFLLSPVGGTWYAQEIHILKRPTVRELGTEIDWIKRADYSLVVFTGHGRNGTNDSTMLQLRTGVEIDANDLKIQGRRQTLILDCCREVQPRELMKRLDEALAFDRARPTLYPNLCRRYYDECLERCDKELVLLHACARGERAGDDSELGGVYSHCLRRAALDWANTFNRAPSNYDTLSIVAAHGKAEELVKYRNPNQHPKIQKPRTGPYFPFSIVA